MMPKDGDKILDIACGNGYLLGELSKKAKVNAYGVDISENMAEPFFSPMVRWFANTVEINIQNPNMKIGVGKI